MATVNSQGTRVYYATASTAWVALAALASPGGSFTEITRIIKTDVDPAVFEDYDDAPLSATTPDPQIIVKPGMMSFSKDKVSAETVILRGFCDGSTLKRYVFLYLDGSADYVDGKLKATKGAAAQRGDYKAHISEDYQVMGSAVVSHAAHA